jgi:hypothetical protein
VNVKLHFHILRTETSNENHIRDRRKKMKYMIILINMILLKEMDYLELKSHAIIMIYFIGVPSIIYFFQLLWTSSFLSQLILVIIITIKEFEK